MDASGLGAASVCPIWVRLLLAPAGRGACMPPAGCVSL